MKLLLPPEIYKNHMGTYTILSVGGSFYVKRIKDVNNYFFKLQNQANNYLKMLLTYSSELELLFGSQFIYMDSHTISFITKDRQIFYERIHYLTFFTYVESVNKLNALYRMTEMLASIAVHLQSKKHLKLIRTMQESFFVNLTYYVQEKEVFTIVQPEKQDNKKYKQLKVS
jgi:hypothetical protein